MLAGAKIYIYIYIYIYNKLIIIIIIGYIQVKTLTQLLAFTWEPRRFRDLSNPHDDAKNVTWSFADEPSFIDMTSCADSNGRSGGWNKFHRNGSAAWGWGNEQLVASRQRSEASENLFFMIVPSVRMAATVESAIRRRDVENGSIIMAPRIGQIEAQLVVQHDPVVENLFCYSTLYVFEWHVYIYLF